jgi:glucosamine-6-phosphate deaminase
MENTKLKIIIGSNDDISNQISEIFINQIKTKPNSILGLATGSSPLKVYANLVKACKEGKVSFKEITTFNLDEYVGLEGTHPQSYRYFMDVNLFNDIDIDKSKTYVLKGVDDYEDYAKKYDDLIASLGGIDLQILGIGSDGHIAFNEPGTSFDSLTHITDLAESTIIDNSRNFNNISEVPKQAVTMGLKSIMNCKKVVLIATGKNKANAINQLVNAEKNENHPCTILRDHPDCTIFVDQDAYSMVKK